MRPVHTWPKQALALLHGEGAHTLAHVWLSGLARRRSVHVIDCAMRFDPLSLAEEAIRSNLAPEALLDRVFIQRAFTPYQILDVVNELLNKEETRQPFVILAPCKQFFDGDVAFDEGLFLLEKLVTLFAEFPAAGKSLLVVESRPYPNPVFQSVFPRLLHLASPVYRLRREEDHRSGVRHYFLQTEKAGADKAADKGRGLRLDRRRREDSSGLAEKRLI